MSDPLILPTARKPLRLMPKAHYVTEHSVFVALDVTPEHVLHPTFWANVAGKLQLGDEITICSEDMAWRMTVMVRGKTSVEAFVSQLSFHAFDAPAAVTSAAVPYESAWRGPQRRFGVIRKDTGEMIKDGFQTRDMADQYIRNALKAQAA